jgi:plastocyanin
MSHDSVGRARRRLKIAFITAPRLQLQRFASTVTVVVLLSAASAGGQSVQPHKGTQHIVIIKQMHFDPPQMTIQTGETVEWKNQDIFSHTVTADDGSFDSGLIAPGGSWQRTIKKAGKIGYHCRPHPNMTATLIVQAAARQ